jgi:hypothetical protein
MQLLIEVSRSRDGEPKRLLAVGTHSDLETLPTWKGEPLPEDFLEWFSASVSRQPGTANNALLDGLYSVDVCEIHRNGSGVNLPSEGGILRFFDRDGTARRVIDTKDASAELQRIWLDMTSTSITKRSVRWTGAPGPHATAGACIAALRDALAELEFRLPVRGRRIAVGR